MTEPRPAFRIDPARPDDVDAIVALVRELAEFERLLHEVRVQPDELREHLFGPRPYCDAALVRVGEEVAGFALWFHNYSTFMGRPGVYLEDLYVRPAYRGHGLGEALLRHVAGIAVARGRGRFEWSVLDWNQRAIGFYRSMGAVPMDEWTVYRVSGDALLQLARGKHDK